MAFIPQIDRITPFNERVFAERRNILNFKPTWGISNINYDIFQETTGFGTGSNGEILLETGTDPDGRYEIQTKDRGQYQAGYEAEVGVGIRVPQDPVGSQFAEWAYSDNRSGLGFGVDSTAPYIFYITDGVKNKVHQSNWNRNTLLDDQGNSTVDFANGIITEVDFVWYGYGDIKWYIIEKNLEGDDPNRTLVHRQRIFQSLTIEDPNQPIRFTVDNNGTGGNSFQLFCGGHQFSILAGTRQVRKRSVSTLFGPYETAGNTEWQPLVAIRKKPDFPPDPNQGNSINVVLRGFQVSATAGATFRITSAPPGTVTNGTWTDVPGWGEESTVQQKITTTGNPLTVGTGPQYPAIYRFVDGTFFQSEAVLQDDREIILGQADEAILSVLRDSAGGTVTVKSALNWEEEW